MAGARGDRPRLAALVAACVISLGWVSALGAAALVHARPDAWPGPPRAAAGLVYLTGSHVCHQRADRSFHVAGAPLPVCARCTGLYVGACGGLLLISALAVGGLQGVRADRPLVLLAALPTLASVGVEWVGGPSPPWTRAVTALPLGAAVAVVVATAIAGWAERRDTPGRRVGARPSATLR